MSFANSYLAYLRSRGALTASSNELKPFSILAADPSPVTAYAITLTRCDDLAGMLASSTPGKVVIGHHFHFDMKTPFQMGSDQFIMLTGRNTIDNPITIDPVVGLAIQPTFKMPSWAQLAASADGAAPVKGIHQPGSRQEAPKGSHPQHPSCPHGPMKFHP